MRVRRCGVLMLEPGERVVFDLLDFMTGGSGLVSTATWIAFAPHVEGAIVVSAGEAAALGALSPTVWIDDSTFVKTHGTDIAASLLEKSLVVGEGSEADARDRKLRDTDWRPAAAVMHYASRWHGVDTEAIQQRFVEELEGNLLERLGPAPPPVRERAAAGERLPLARPARSALDALLDGRVTCRNFAADEAMRQADFAAVLYRAYGARVVDDYAPGVQILKKGVPSAGGLHPTEAYLLVRHVEGIAPGLYHYHPVEHALEPIRTLSPDEATALARRFVGAQAYLVGAHAFVIPVSRFRRNFWKYRNHAKAYRALILDIGHLSQTMYLAATELGLAAFITAAVNEADIEAEFGLDPLEEGPLAVTGFGIRAAERSEVEFDPLHAVWKDA
ncbi:MAG TPA: putative peptide maturation dehydrogenase [Rhodanobacteraceae bacterium]|nr:putative peptide maturation dehydrogenase [Rhodanobacteraceae bacterium]